MFCARCGTALSVEARYCEECGAPQRRAVMERVPRVRYPRPQAVELPSGTVRGRDRFDMAALLAGLAMLVTLASVPGVLQWRRHVEPARIQRNELWRGGATGAPWLRPGWGDAQDDGGSSASRGWGSGPDQGAGH